ncbi:MAG: cohesin domain-containing protein [Patescibacteria group bacterium]
MHTHHVPTKALRATFSCILIALAIIASSRIQVHAQSTVNLSGPDLIPKTEILISPPSGTFTQGSTFEVPIYINTKGSSIGAIELRIRFDAETLSVVKPSGGSSVIGLWIEAPSYDNARGTITLVGGIPNGITTESGLLANITFQAKSAGPASVRIQDDTRILLNDGVGSPANHTANRAVYTIVSRPPGGVVVFSETHPLRDHWYNNPTISLAWTPEPGVSGYSMILDDKPNTIPDNTVDTESTARSYQEQPDGAWYFHIKALKNGVWGASTDFALKIDTAPPADFEPRINYITAAVISRALISFFTTDALSGLDRYEVGLIDKSKPATESPVFVRSESPYQVPFESIDHSRLIVRAFDKAGNVRDASIDVSLPFLPTKFIRDHAVALLLTLLILMMAGFVLHYFFGHHIARHVSAIWRLITDRKRLEKLEDDEQK